MSLLTSAFDVSVATLNYDNVLCRVLPDNETGFSDDGEFEDVRLFTRERWPCFLHLHGSIHFDWKQFSSEPWKRLYWQPDVRVEFQHNAFGSGDLWTSEGMFYPNSTVIAGLGKSTRILANPFRAYYSEFQRLVAECDALLIVGYGFSDLHINAALGEFRDRRKRPVMIVDHRNDNELSFGSNTDDGGVLDLFSTKPWTMSRFGVKVPSNVFNLKSANEFELSDEPNTPLYIWYNGFLEACRHPEKFLHNLQRHFL
jgi:hypothetical protein